MTLICGGLVGPGTRICSVNSTWINNIYVVFVDSYFEMLVLTVALVPYVRTFQNCFDFFLICSLICRKRLVNYARGWPSWGIWLYSCQVQRILIRPSAVKSPTPTPLVLQIKDFCNFLTFSWKFMKIYMIYTDLHTELFGFMCTLDVWTLCLGGSSLGGSVRASARPSAPVRPSARPPIRLSGSPPRPKFQCWDVRPPKPKKQTKTEDHSQHWNLGCGGPGQKNDLGRNPLTETSIEFRPQLHFGCLDSYLGCLDLYCGCLDL